MLKSDQEFYFSKCELDAVLTPSENLVSTTIVVPLNHGNRQLKVVPWWLGLLALKLAKGFLPRNNVAFKSL